MSSITQRSTLTLTLATFLTFSSGLLGGGWWARGLVSEQSEAIRKLEAKIDKLQVQVASLRGEVWTMRDMNAWSGRFRWENRAIPLSVPEPREFRDFRPHLDTSDIP